ncbi:MAG: XRE family transcriptional regulator [Verrucomicrobiaceae bacterium]|nr:MAG: XRE family transcriptional regulator [Verrucomicrobiaceae bacterium]
MNPKEFARWRFELGLSQENAAKALGISRSTVINYEKGKLRGGKGPCAIPRSIELACEALAVRANLPPDCFRDRSPSAE